jgi:uncharacterized protein
VRIHQDCPDLPVIEIIVGVFLIAGYLMLKYTNYSVDKRRLFVMSNIEVVKDAYAKFGAGDVAGLIGLCTEDIHWQTPVIENAKFGGIWHGHAGVGDFFMTLAGDENITHFEPIEFIADGEKVVVSGKSASTVKSTDKKYETDWVHIFTVQAGKITKFIEFFDNHIAATKAFAK